MADEQTLGKLLAGRTIQGTRNKNTEMTLSFSDGSTMTIETGASSFNSAATGGTIRGVHQSEASLHIDLVDGKAMVIPLTGKNAAIRVQGKDGTTEYEG